MDKPYVLIKWPDRGPSRYTYGEFISNYLWTLETQGYRVRQTEEGVAEEFKWGSSWVQTYVFPECIIVKRYKHKSAILKDISRLNAVQRIHEA